MTRELGKRADKPDVANKADTRAMTTAPGKEADKADAAKKAELDKKNNLREVQAEHAKNVNTSAMTIELGRKPTPARRWQSLARNPSSEGKPASARWVGSRLQ